MKYIIIICVLISLSACIVVPQSVFAKRLGQISMGITKADVLKIMEITPDRFKAHLNTEYIIYETHHGDYFVRLTDGKVNAYGNVGDFDSLKDPALNVNIKSETISK